MPDNLSLHLSGSSKRLNSRQLMESSNETFAPNNVDLEKEYKSSQSNITTEVYEASSFEEKVSSEKPQYSSFWKKIYYEYVVVDKSILGVSILDSFMYNQDLKPVEKKGGFGPGTIIVTSGLLNVSISILGKLQLQVYNWV